MVFPLQYNMCCLSLCQICNSFIYRYTERRREANSSIQALSLSGALHVLLMHCSLCVLYPTQLKGTLKNLLLLQIDYFHLSLSVLTSSHSPLCNIRSMREPAYYRVGSAPRNINNSTLLAVLSLIR